MVGRRTVWLTCAGVLSAFLVVPATTSSALLAVPRSSGSATAAPETSAATRAGAMAVARRDGRVTEVTGLTSDRRLVMADPATGTFTETLNAGPVRARVGDRWAPLDPTLVLAGGRVEPVLSSVGLSVSAGGRGDLVRLTEGEHSFAFRWPDALPAPVLRRDSAVFPDVHPGIDLVVAAQATGFRELLVVHDRAAAADPWLRRIALGVDAPGQSVRLDGSRLKAYDRAGHLTFTSEPVRMWDSGARRPSPGSATDTSLWATSSMPEGRSAPVRVRASADHVELVPDRAMLSSASTVFPVVIDPSMSGARTRFASVDSSGSKGAYATTNKNETPWIGLQKISGARYGGLVSRISYGFEVPQELSGSGVKILSAKFRHLQVQSTETGTDCTKQTNGPKINLWETHDFSDDFDWDHQPDTVMKMSASQLVVGNVTKCNAAGYPNKAGVQEWDALAGVLDHIDDQDDILSFRINEEFDNNDDPSATVRASGTRYYQNSLSYPALVIEYNGAPQAPAATSVSPSAVYQGETFVSSTSPVLRTTVRDENTTQDVTAAFSLTPSGGTATTYTSGAVRGPGTAGAVASTAPGQVVVANGARYAVAVRANDGVVDSAAGPGTAFTVDTTSPGAPGVTGVPTSTVPAGKAFTLTVDAPETDVASYAYGLNTSDPTTKVTPGSLGGPATLTITPTQFGPGFVSVRSYDRAGNRTSTPVKVAFKVDGGLPSHRYRLDWSGTDDRSATAPGSVAQNIPIPAATFVNGRDRFASDGATTLDCRDRALSVSASTATRSVTSPSPYALDTTQAFTVSAWLKPEGTTGTATGNGDESYAVSMPASSSAAALSLGYRKDPTSGQVYWLFTVAGTSGRVRVEDAANRSSAIVRPGQWTHLSGVFDPVVQTGTLYVDGVKVAQTGITSTPFAANQLELGSGPLGTAALQWTGAVDEVLLYQGALSQTAVNAQRNDRRPVSAC